MKKLFELIAKNGLFIAIAIIVLCIVVSFFIPLFVGIARDMWEWAL